MPTLNWIGKEAVINHHLDVPFHLLKDVPDLGCGDPGSGNLIVEGDNLLALKDLLPYYKGKVKCICIDPPYNTGNEGWAYNDNVNSPAIKKWLGETVGKEGETHDRHDRWLCMMYPWLELLREFLSEDGVILISLDEVEVAVLKLILDELFGKQNALGTIAWNTRNTDNRIKAHLSPDHEYVVVYGRSEHSRIEGRIIDRSDFKNPDNDQRGPYVTDPLTGKATAEARPNIHAYNMAQPGTANVWKPDPTPPVAPRLPSLDGWRALSIVLVLGNHCIVTADFPPLLHTFFFWAFDGGLGVQIFFVISGFLITYLMLLEDGLSGRINLSHFYARRGLRILPVYAAFICVLAGFQLFTPFQQTRNAWIGNLTFTTNFVDAPWTSMHLWSIAGEEQFYLLWPGLFVVFRVARNRRAAFWILTLPILLAPFLRVVSYLKLAPSFLMPLFANYSFFNFFDSLAVGCGCAFIFLHRRDLLRHWLTTRRKTVAALALVLILAPYVMRHLFILGIINVPFGGILSALGVSMLLLQSLLLPSSGFYRLLNQPAVCQIGVLSYSIYIWQQIFCTKPEVFGLEHVWWMGFPGWLLPVIVVSLVSYYGFERPLFRLRALFRKS